MNQNDISQALLNHFKDYPLLEPQDAFKFLYHAIFGCEHMISSEEKVIEYIKNESKTASKHSKLVEPLFCNYARLNLDILNSGLKAETLGRLFFLTSKKEKGSLNDLSKAIEVLKELAVNKQTPFTEEKLIIALSEWKEKGYPAIHHSETFRQNYHPSYRVISKEFIKLLPLLCEIDKKAEVSDVVIAIEGSSASGKTTLSRQLSDIYNCSLFHTDDFFLQPHQRTEERLSTPGGNLDRERFLQEILIPLSEKKDICYHKFDCSKMALGDKVTAVPKRITVIEGAYSMHPDFKEYYDISVFLDIDESLQKSRILNRNPDMTDRFLNEWIPMEKKYFDAFDIREKCDFVISAN